MKFSLLFFAYILFSFMFTHAAEYAQKPALDKEEIEALRGTIIAFDKFVGELMDSQIIFKKESGDEICTILKLKRYLSESLPQQSAAIPRDTLLTSIKKAHAAVEIVRKSNPRAKSSLDSIQTNLDNMQKILSPVSSPKNGKKSKTFTFEQISTAASSADQAS